MRPAQYTRAGPLRAACLEAFDLSAVAEAVPTLTAVAATYLPPPG
jgi:hypothetical protein